MISAEIVSAWFVVFLTLCIFSFLYKDNPFYKAAEHIFVGVSAGYIFTITFWDTIWPNLPTISPNPPSQVSTVSCPMGSTTVMSPLIEILPLGGLAASASCN